MGFVIAVDGPAASGKGTISSKLAEAFGFPHLDTGLLYRGVAALVNAAGGDLDDEAAAAMLAQQLDLNALDDWRCVPAPRGRPPAGSLRTQRFARR